MIAALKLLPWRYIGLALAVLGALWWAKNWHADQVAAVRIAAMQEQASLDAADFEAARQEAERQQQQEIAAQVQGARAVNKEQIDALQARNDRIGRDYAALRLRWKQAQAEAGAGRPSQDGTTAVSADAGTDPFAAARAAGWVDFDTAAALAEAADRATASAVAKVNWWWEQCRAWRGPKPEECM